MVWIVCVSEGVIDKDKKIIRNRKEVILNCEKYGACMNVLCGNKLVHPVEFKSFLSYSMTFIVSVIDCLCLFIWR